MPVVIPPEWILVLVINGAPFITGGFASNSECLYTGFAIQKEFTQSSVKFSCFDRQGIRSPGK